MCSDDMCKCVVFFFFKQKTAYEMRISDWSSDVCSSDLLQLRNISKRYPGCLANDAIDLSIQPGEIHALLGENGAGKSTLMKIIYGVTQADSGEVIWQGQQVDLRNPAQARSLGIGMVFQRSAERRVGKEWVSTCRSRWWQ